MLKTVNHKNCSIIFVFKFLLEISMTLKTFLHFLYQMTKKKQLKARDSAVGPKQMFTVALGYKVDAI